ncbi:hypothetical protein Scel_84020 [Streptomyces cellostaticus]|nr:hypothetical protein Scel_84020 [Streptomyces cellostaticus]
MVHDAAVAAAGGAGPPVDGVCGGQEVRHGCQLLEQQLAGLRWLVVAGERHEVFRSLGAAARDSVRAVLGTPDEDDELKSWLRSAEGKHRFTRLVETTRRRCGTQLAELAALADGSGVGFEDLLLLNLLGDLGVPDGTGCSNVAWRRETSFVAHNEDGFPTEDGHLMVITLNIEGQTPVTALWYPGFLTANAFTATGSGLVWGGTHIPVVRPGLTGAGRHFIARALQQAPTLDAAVAHLRAHPTAGGYACTLGDSTSGRVAVVEAVAGRVAVHETDATHPLLWHTNHLRYLPEPPDDPALLGDSRRAGAHASRYEESMARGRVLAAITPPQREPSTAWFVETLTSESLPHGVHRTAHGADQFMTLCTVVADLSSGTIMLRNPKGNATQLALSDFTHGNAASMG